MQLYLGDCLEVMKQIPDGSVDMVLADLPYGTTACKWDTVIPFEPLWAEYRRVSKVNAAIVLFGSQPFTSALVMSNPDEYRYDWYWYKNNPTGIALAKTQPMRAVEILSVFYRKQPTFNKQMMDSRITDRSLGRPNGKFHSHNKGDDVTHGMRVNAKKDNPENILREKVNPRNVLEFKVVPRAKGTLHPTQKPTPLLEYLIRTYTNEGETVLDNTMGSGSTGVACVNTGRKFIGIEKDPGYFQVAEKRIFTSFPAFEKQVAAGEE